MLVRDEVVRRMAELDIDHCAAVVVDGESLPIVTANDPRMEWELNGREIWLLGAITNAEQAMADHELVRMPCHVCYDGCEELED